ncbi:MAG TPA: hypothetical protein VFA20_31710 [Myxococcaceae bacterium]|nr:hypothetical protein [Myxococcaceae bacterium]
MSNPTNPTRIDSTPVRISTNLTIDRQTPKADFGDRLAAGMQTVGGAIASGAAIAAPLVPGSAIVSAAVSSVSQLGGNLGQGTSSGAATAGIYNSGVVGLGGGTGINTTVGGGGNAPIGNVGTVGGGIGGGGGMGGVAIGGGGIGQGGLGGGQLTSVPGPGTDISSMQNLMAQQAKTSFQMLGLQQQMQQENQVFTTVSNVLKTRHDTVKNTISNVR